MVDAESRSCSVSREYMTPVTFLTELQLFNISLEPDKIQSLHCRPQTSTAIACSWTPPDSDFDGYSVECKKMDTREVEFSKRIEKDKSLLNIMTLVPHKRYLVSIKVHSADMTSEVVEDSTITMIDRKWNSELPWRQALSSNKQLLVG